ncbi:hypothetical protein BU26DRAFT_565119 [Trematosphaeria pertusa]|uniref:Hypervirulence associated protein TUDOR domain-containing protein n=1 Tax=Trematosphaeria pertusa TaxID=390896 RepID=A0A6A6IIU2_9PLEO|nr:uncharacterized protein BU26DRAFT_565119 [Trematosphaeria pertusa]KAF2249473.1 hypothetical protein BU26DRAFT_565119 [Trematosphaeria pertusa]
MPQYEEGQTVRYKAIGPNSNTAESTGIIKKVATEPTTLAHRKVDASEERPRYEIENSNTGKTAAIYEENILRVAK